jgi:DNA-binding transcriptional LysR family regulator
MSRQALALNAPGQFAVLDVEGFPILRHWYAVYPAGRQLSVVARAFLDYLLGRSNAAPVRPANKK